MTAAATLSTVSKLAQLIRTTNLNLTRASAIFETFGLTGVSDSNLNRAIQRGKFPSQKMDDEIREIVLRMERLVKFLKPFKPSFEDAGTVHTMLEILNGCDVEIDINPKGIDKQDEEVSVR